MSTLKDIREALPNLNMNELLQVEQTLHQLQRERSDGIIFDDAYGVWTAEDHASAAAEAWAILDGDASA